MNNGIKCAVNNITQNKQQTSKLTTSPSLNELFPELNGLDTNYEYNAKSSEQENLDDAINNALLSIDEYQDEPNNSNQYKNQSNENSITDFSPFDTPITISSITDDEVEQKGKPCLNLETIASVKKSMVDSSKLIGLFTTLKSTYLKLCKEFNYLLSKFNENEKVKIQLIQENLKLKNLLSELLESREEDNRKFNKRLNEERKRRRVDYEVTKRDDEIIQNC